MQYLCMKALEFQLENEIAPLFQSLIFREDREEESFCLHFKETYKTEVCTLLAQYLLQFSDISVKIMLCSYTD